jgi:uncharacterized membrane protein SpoIIM required for sporulation
MTTTTTNLNSTSMTTPKPQRNTLQNALIVTRREVLDSMRDWRILVPILILTFGFPFVAQTAANSFVNFTTEQGARIIGERTIPFLLMIIGFFPISISLVIALETFVGEKERRSLEPLLSTPLTDTELYIGKTLAAMIPPLVSSYGGMAVYLVTLLFGEIAWRPPAMLILQIVLLTTVQALVMVTGAVVISSQTTSTRAANLLASFIIIPMSFIIQGESIIMFFAWDWDSPTGISSLWWICLGMVAAVALLLRLGNSIFNREELLGRMIDQVNLRGMAVGVWRNIIAIDDKGTPARNLWEWYTKGVPNSLYNARYALAITPFIFIAAFLVGMNVGSQPQWQIDLPDQPDLGRAARLIGTDTGTVSPTFVFTNNLRIIVAVMILSFFSFGVAALLITPAVFAVFGWIASQFILNNYDLNLLWAAILPHGTVEIPMAIIAAAMSLRLGAIITRPPQGKTVGEAWSLALGDTLKVFFGVVLPLMLIGALIEAYITPGIVRGVLESMASGG